MVWGNRVGRANCLLGLGVSSEKRQKFRCYVVDWMLFLLLLLIFLIRSDFLYFLMPQLWSKRFQHHITSKSCFSL
jgi:hypothetical protein